MRIGLVSDLHWMAETPASSAGWHGGGEFAGVLDRLAASVERFAAEDVDGIVLSGDLSHHGDGRSLDQVLSAVGEASAPVTIVAGNHDVGEDPEAVAAAIERAADPNLELATPAGHDVGEVRIAGVQVGEAEGWFGARLEAHPESAELGEGPVVLVSHYPVLSLAERISAAGLPYPGDLLDRAELAEVLSRRDAPTIVLGGHIHARATQTSGPVLQLSAGALVEPPYECAVIEVEPGPDGELSVTRRCTRLLASDSPLQPVFAADEETWRLADGRWASFAPITGSAAA